jgi:hypothetical protein
MNTAFSTQEDIIYFPAHYNVNEYETSDVISEEEEEVEGEQEEAVCGIPYLESTFQFLEDSVVENMTPEEYEAYHNAYLEHIDKYCDYVQNYNDPDYNIYGYAIEDTYPEVPPGLGFTEDEDEDEDEDENTLTENLEDEDAYIQWLTQAENYEAMDIHMKIDMQFYEAMNIHMKIDIQLENAKAVTASKIIALGHLGFPIELLEHIYSYVFMIPCMYKQKKYNLYVFENFIQNGKMVNDIIIKDYDGIVFCNWFFGSYHPDSVQLNCMFCMSCGEYIGTHHHMLRRLCRCAPLLPN